MSLFKVMSHGTIFNDDFQRNVPVACVQFLMQKIVATMCFMVLNGLSNTLLQQIAALKIVRALCCVKNRLLKIAPCNIAFKRRNTLNERFTMVRAN